MKAFLIALAAAGLVAVPMARAEQQTSTPDKAPPQTSSSSQSSLGQSSPSSQSSSSMSQTPSSQTSTSTSASSQTGASASASNELTGTVKKVDKDKKSIKISSLTGGEQELKVADSAKITKDGTQCGLDQIKEGDQVRASFDASGNQASRIEVSSKAKSDHHDSSSSKSDSDKKSDSKKSDSDTKSDSKKY